MTASVDARAWPVYRAEQTLINNSCYRLPVRREFVADGDCAAFRENAHSLVPLRSRARSGPAIYRATTGLRVHGVNQYRQQRRHGGVVRRAPGRGMAQVLGAGGMVVVATRSAC